VSAVPLQRGDVVRIRDARWTIADATVCADATVITVHGCDRSNRGARTRYLLPFEQFERLPAVGSTQVVSFRSWRVRARQVLGEAVPSIDALRTAAAGDLRILPFQLEPALAVVSRLATRILIADEVGLGKTVQAGLIIAETLARRHDAHVLVLCPAGLREQWRDELTTRFGLSATVLDSASLRRTPAADQANPWAVHPLVLTSTDYVKRPEVLRALEPLVWDLLVVDEAHGIAGQSDRHAAATLLAERARVVVMLTATPHSGDEQAFGRLTAIGDIDGLFPLLAFRRTRAEVTVGTRRRTHWLSVRPTDVERRMHRTLLSYVQRVWRQPASTGARLAMIVLTRRACSSAASLTRSLERRLSLLAGEAGETDEQMALPLGPEENDDEPDAPLGAPGLSNARVERRSLETILALARQAGSAESKLAALTRLLRRADEPAIVFTEYRDTLSTLAAHLGGVRTCQLHGGLSSGERAAILGRFTSGECRILLATDAASEGLNLQHRCRLVIHLEVPWTPTRIEQRVGRVDRIGQTRIVHQVHLIAEGSVEASRVATVARRALRANRVLASISSVPAIHDGHTAAYVIGDEPLDEDDIIPVMPHGVITTDLRDRSVAEAERIIVSRRLRPASDDETRVWTPRPFAVAVRRRPPGCNSCCAVWFDYIDEGGHLIWEALIGLEVTGPPRTPLRATADVREFVDALWRTLPDSIALAPVPTIERLATAIEREEAIVRCAHQHYARMASELLQQRGLFDRRSDREATAQRELLERICERCRTRVAELWRRRVVTIAGVRPAFSLTKC
jgi:superfamily II DNA or RNA helicase